MKVTVRTFTESEEEKSAELLMVTMRVGYSSDVSRWRSDCDLGKTVSSSLQGHMGQWGHCSHLVLNICSIYTIYYDVYNANDYWLLKALIRDTFPATLSFCCCVPWPLKHGCHVLWGRLQQHDAATSCSKRPLGGTVQWTGWAVSLIMLQTHRHTQCVGYEIYECLYLECQSFFKHKCLTLVPASS